VSEHAIDSLLSAVKAGNAALDAAQARIAALEAVIAAHNARLTHACATHPFTARCAALSKDGECLYCPLRLTIEMPA